MFLLNGFFDLLLAGLGTHILIVFRMHNARLMERHLSDFLNVYRCGDV